MSAQHAEHVVRKRMSHADYLALPEGLRAEYVDGEVIVTPPARSGHNTAQRRLANTIEAALDPSLDVTTDAGWRHGSRDRIPDVAVFRKKEDVVFYEQIPLIVAEVLSPNTRGEDTVRKSHEYAVAGVEQYWVVDRDNHQLTVYANTGDGWDIAVELDAEHPRGEATVGRYGTVTLDLDELFRR